MIVEVARFSPCRRWRYALDVAVARTVLHGDLPSRGSLGVIMLNPSTADERRLDPTIRRVAGFASAWGFHRIRIRNLFAYRATQPDELPRVGAELGLDPVGEENDHAILELADPTFASTILVAWGASLGDWKASRVDEVRDMLRDRSMRQGDVVCLGVTADGEPRHPLYVPARAVPERWAP